MKLFLIHTGYYNKNVDNGFYEQHSNIFVIAKDAYNAREKVKKKKIFIDNKMHIDGIQEIQNIDGYDIQLSKSKSVQKNKTYNHYQVRFLKKS